MQLRKIIDVLKVSKCVMLFVNFHCVAVYNSAVMEFWPLPFEYRIKLFLTSLNLLTKDSRRVPKRKISCAIVFTVYSNIYYLYII